MSEPKRLSILLIEDNPGDVHLIRAALADMPDVRVDLVLASRLSTGLEQLAAGGVDVVLLDLSLPDSHGLETFLQVQQRCSGVPVIVLSGLRDEGLAVEAVQKGAQDYLNKAYVPLDSAFLARSVRYAIERKRVERELLRLASFAEQNPHPIIEADAGGAVTYLNPAARAQFPDLETRTPRHPLLDGLEAVFPDGPAAAQRSIAREVTLGSTVYEQHLSWIPDTGLIRSYIIDITERKQVDHLKDEFLSIVSHELRTPLATIKEFLAIISDQLAGPVTAVQQEYLGIIQGNLERFARIINDVLDMAKIEAGHLVVRKARIEIKALLHQVVQSMRPLADRKRIELVLDVPEGLPALFADADKVIQALVNLIDNAIKFINGPGQVTLSAADRPDDIRFSVTDTGVGISADDLPTLFEKFRQVRSVPVEGGPKGTGLGLAITKRLIELHGGRVWAISQLGRGSTFSFTLPKHAIEEVLEECLRANLELDKGEPGGHFSLVLLAIDRYGALKARHGLEAMQHALDTLEAVIREIMYRPGDLVIRWKEDKIIVGLEGDQATARLLARRITQRLEQRTAAMGLSPAISFLVSTATCPEEAGSAKELLQLTERHLQPASR